MPKTRNTPFNSDNEYASRYHYICGNCCYFTDADDIEMMRGSFPMYCEYTYDKNQTKPVAIIDYKYPGKKVSTRFSAIQCQITIADTCHIPFFFAICYLDDNFPTKCYYIVPVNQIAKNMFIKWKFDLKGKWFSLRGYSRFQHGLRNVLWNGSESIRDENLLNVGLPAGMKLKDLSCNIISYPLPIIEVP